MLRAFYKVQYKFVIIDLTHIRYLNILNMELSSIGLITIIQYVNQQI